MSNSYFNPFPTNFIETLNSDIYVDKTDLIIHLNKLINTNKKYICVSRPRRFGKTVTADMLVAYYRYLTETQKKEEEILEKLDNLFEKKKLVKYHDWNEYLGKFNVIKLDMFTCFSKTKIIDEGENYIKKNLIKEIKRSIPNFKFSEDNEEIIEIFKDIHYNTKKKIIIIIDEWDYVIRKKYRNNEKAQEDYIDFLTRLIKDKNYISLTYMTGILPIKKYDGQSSIDFFDEYSMTNPQWLAKYVGFTEEEVKVLWVEFQNKENQDLPPKRRKLNEELNSNKIEASVEKEEIEKKETFSKKENESNLINNFSFYSIQKWYNGYILSDNEKEYHVYTPLSIVKALTNKKIINYWNRTETFKSLSNFINMNFDGLKEDITILIDNNKLKIDIETYTNDMTSFNNKDDVLTMLVHLGYLGYIEKDNEVFIPNNELMNEFKNCTKNGIEWKKTMEKLKRSDELLKSTWSCDKKNVAELIERAHDNASNNTYNSEAALKYAILLAYYRANDYYTIIQEVDTGKGYADIIFIPINNKPALVVELKYNKSANGAIKQTKDRNYPDCLQHYKSNILLVGINYDKTLKSNQIEYKHHSCEIERYID